jgi:hypothetical protein
MPGVDSQSCRTAAYPPKNFDRHFICVCKRAFSQWVSVHIKTQPIDTGKTGVGVILLRFSGMDCNLQTVASHEFVKNCPKRLPVCKPRFSVNPKKRGSL